MSCIVSCRVLSHDQDQGEQYYSCSLFIAESSIRIIVAGIDSLEFGDPDFFFHRRMRHLCKDSSNQWCHKTRKSKGKIKRGRMMVAMYSDTAWL